MMMSRTPDFGTLIRKRRAALGISLPALAKQMKVSKSLLLYWERGDRIPQPPNLQRLATALGIDFETLYERAGHARSANLPGLQLYLRRKHHLTKTDTERVERYVARLKAQKRKGGDRAERDR